MIHKKHKDFTTILEASLPCGFNLWTKTKPSQGRLYNMNVKNRYFFNIPLLERPTKMGVGVQLSKNYRHETFALL
jgi:hypothetical protein